jgi:cell division transport system permease protein
MQKLIYVIQEGLKGLRRNGLVSLAAMGIIGCCLLITGLFALVSLNLQLNVEQMMGDREFLVYLEDDLTQEQSDEVGATLAELEGTEDVTYISNQQALEERLQEDSLTSIYFRNVDYHLLQNRYHVTVQEAEQLEGCVTAAQEISGVDHVSASYSLAQQISNIRNYCLTGTVIAMVVLVLVSIFIISYAVRLAVAAREEEIVIMRLVGATKRFICAPFLVEGILTGAVGGLIAFGVTSALYMLAVRTIAESGVFQIYTYRTVALVLFGAQLLAGILTGVIGTMTSMRRALRT